MEHCYHPHPHFTTNIITSSTSFSACTETSFTDMTFLGNFLEVIPFLASSICFIRLKDQHSQSLSFPLSNFLQFITHFTYFGVHRILLSPCLNHPLTSQLPVFINHKLYEDCILSSYRHSWHIARVQEIFVELTEKEFGPQLKTFYFRFYF